MFSFHDWIRLHRPHVQVRESLCCQWLKDKSSLCTRRSRNFMPSINAYHPNTACDLLSTLHACLALILLQMIEAFHFDRAFLHFCYSGNRRSLNYPNAVTSIANGSWPLSDMCSQLVPVTYPGKWIFRQEHCGDFIPFFVNQNRTFLVPLVRTCTSDSWMVCYITSGWAGDRSPSLRLNSSSVIIWFAYFFWLVQRDVAHSHVPQEMLWALTPGAPLACLEHHHSTICFPIQISRHNATCEDSGIKQSCFPH